MERWMRIAGSMVLFGICVAEPHFAQSETATESKFLTIGDISGIDLKGKSITISAATSYNIAQLSQGGGTPVPGGRGGAGGAGRAAVRGGRRGGGARSAPSSGREASAPIPMEYKVIVSSKTIIKDGDSQIKIDDLKVGDRLQVFSMKGGTKLDASEIIKTPKENSPATP